MGAEDLGDQEELRFQRFGGEKPLGEPKEDPMQKKLRYRHNTEVRQVQVRGISIPSSF